MSKIIIAGCSVIHDGWRCQVEVQEKDQKLSYEVEVSKEYCQQLSGDDKPQELIRRSFEFLLSKESKESILRKFNLRDIQGFFPDYEETIQK